LQGKQYLSLIQNELECPMREYKNLSRIYVSSEIKYQQLLSLDANQSHYLIDVMRRKLNDSIRIFNESSGDWRAEIAAINKKSVNIIPCEQLKKAQIEPRLILLFSPLKRPAIDFLIEKATEMGVTEFQPVLTQNSYVKKLNADRARANAIEAAEQCERLSIPIIREPSALKRVLESWDAAITLIVADEAIKGFDLPSFLNEIVFPIAILIGPEGGFTDQERLLFDDYNFIKKISLGPRILRAETAVIAGLSIIQALKGDWQKDT
jgi:16S rRNA (uracil1498-N3)-methyltransferase